MKSDCYFDECKDCMYKNHNDELLCCLYSRMRLAKHKLCLEVPIINKFVDKYKYCNWFIKDVEDEDKE